MDLLSSESKKTGTRGGRGNFTWDSVQDKDRHYYLGNSIAKPIIRQYGSTSNQDPLWYARRNESNEIISSQPTNEKIEQENDNDMNIGQERRIIIRREKKIMENVVVGRSFSDAVRCALAESVASSVDDEGSHGDGEEISQTKTTIRRQEKNEKAERKEMRKRIREQRRVRRAERNRVRLGKEEAVDAINRSSESERESWRQNRLHDDGSKRRRRRGRDYATRRKRSDFCSSSDSDDSDSHRTRRQRLR